MLVNYRDTDIVIDMAPSPERKRERLRIVAEEILTGSSMIIASDGTHKVRRYMDNVREIMSRFDVSEATAKRDIDEAQALLPAVIAARANQIRARAVATADAAIQAGYELACDSSDMAKIAGAAASLATTLEKIDPANWITTKEAVTEILRALATEELDEEQMALAAKLSQRLKAADDQQDDK